jgi:hypothetical protein
MTERNRILPASAKSGVVKRLDGAGGGTRTSTTFAAGT